MRELALFAGAGGGILGGLLAGWRTVAACEIDPRCREILLARQRNGCLHEFPIWDDVRTFDGAAWRGCVDIVTGGFPCQPFSTASRGRANAIDLWPDMLRIIGEVEPMRVLAENVQREPIEIAALGLRRLGYHCVVLRAPASAVGAPHRRVRWFVAADADGKGQHAIAEHAQMAGLRAGTISVWAEPPAVGVAHGVADRLDVYPHAVGNGQVPQVVHAIAIAAGWVSNG